MYRIWLNTAYKFLLVQSMNRFTGLNQLVMWVKPWAFIYHIYITMFFVHIFLILNDIIHQGEDKIENFIV